MIDPDFIRALSANPKVSLGPTGSIVIGAFVAVLIVWVFSVAVLGGLGIADRGARDHRFFVSLLFAASVGACALVVVRDLSIPARLVGIGKPIVAIPFVTAGAIALHEMTHLGVHELSRDVHYLSWFSCYLQIIFLALLAYAAIAFCVRQLAPTNLAQTGLYVGMLSGALGVLGHCWHGSNEALALNILLYFVAIGTMALAGRLMGRHLLHWR